MIVQLVRIPHVQQDLVGAKLGLSREPCLISTSKTNVLVVMIQRRYCVGDLLQVLVFLKIVLLLFAPESHIEDRSLAEASPTHTVHGAKE